MNTIIRYLTTFIICLIHSTAIAQTSWLGDTSHFNWKSNSNDLNANIAGTSSIFHPISWDSTTVLSINVNVNFAPSTNNFISLLLSSDSIYDPNNDNNLELRIGQSGNLDAWDIFQNQTKIITDSLRLWGKGGTAQLQLIQKKDSIYFQINTIGSSPRIINTIQWFKKFKYVHIQATYTNSNRNNFSFSDFFVGQPQIDTTPPKLERHKILNNHIIQLHFNENLFKNHLSFVPQPDSIIKTSNYLELRYAKPFSDFTLNLVDSINDYQNNWILIDTNLTVNLVQEFDLLITEVYANPNSSPGNYNSEFIEIQNVSGDEITIKDLELYINEKAENLKDTVLRKNEYLYIEPKSAILNGGCQIQLQINNEIIHAMDFTLATYANTFKADGGWSLEIQNTDYGCANENWKACDDPNGATPNAVNSVHQSILSSQAFLIKSVFPNSDSSIVIRFSHPITKSSINSIPFEILGLVIQSFHIKNNEITLYTDLMKNNTTYELKHKSTIESCIGQLQFNNSIQFGLTAEPSVDDIYINEVLFNPDPFGSDYIEIVNKSNQYFDLNQLTFASLDSDGNLTDFNKLSPTSELIAPNEIICFSSDPSWVEQQYYQSGKILFTKLPACNNDADHILLLNQLGDTIDQLFYDENWHYSELNTTENISLSKINSTGSNNEDNWFSSASANNYGTPGLPNDYQFEPTTPVLSEDVITPNNDGINDMLVLNLKFEEPGWTGTIEVFNSEGIIIHTLVKNQIYGSLPIVWNMTKTNGDLIGKGIYALLFQGVHIESGKNRMEKITFYVNR